MNTEQNLSKVTYTVTSTKTIPVTVTKTLTSTIFMPDLSSNRNVESKTFNNQSDLNKESTKLVTSINTYSKNNSVQNFSTKSLNIKQKTTVLSNSLDLKKNFTTKTSLANNFTTNNYKDLKKLETQKDNNTYSKYSSPKAFSVNTKPLTQKISKTSKIKTDKHTKTQTDLKSNNNNQTIVSNNISSQIHSKNNQYFSFYNKNTVDSLESNIYNNSTVSIDNSQKLLSSEKYKTSSQLLSSEKYKTSSQTQNNLLSSEKHKDSSQKYSLSATSVLTDNLFSSTKYPNQSISSTNVLQNTDNLFSSEKYPNQSISSIDINSPSIVKTNTKKPVTFSTNNQYSSKKYSIFESYGCNFKDILKNSSKSTFNIESESYNTPYSKTRNFKDILKISSKSTKINQELTQNTYSESKIISNQNKVSNIKPTDSSMQKQFSKSSKKLAIFIDPTNVYTVTKKHISATINNKNNQDKNINDNNRKLEKDKYSLGKISYLLLLLIPFGVGCCIMSRYHKKYNRPITERQVIGGEIAEQAPIVEITNIDNTNTTTNDVGEDTQISTQPVDENVVQIDTNL